eukprot:CAMPEP_0113400088 /NCGR_PEP_ID=MMETSP0013_2-20120614/15924_1 /TAXON_ID=2843 ORGANISM="Skeletonema costatum, Strain 1716" /NCGR_SAMPLE_ID=MMETSP0013_2 /ASSEMBLY_ACC=CAM_ASM_000158 /LENGTH=618 /DNA_ID=CAMNT_0000285109 /DNA_START=70 /DNA_END=1922 /DNA_ORIENTATION=+ /assembly_acc=CAM_ASM_000158
MVSVKHIILRTSCALVFVVVMASIPQMHSLVHKEHLAFQCIHSASIARSRRTASDHCTITSSSRIIKPSLLHMSAIAPNQDNSTSQTVSKRKRVLNLLGLHKFTKKQVSTQNSKEEKPLESGPFDVTTVKELDEYFDDVKLRFRKGKSKNQAGAPAEKSRKVIDYDALVASLSVEGDTQIIGSAEHKDLVHPVVQLLHERRRQIEKIKTESETDSVNSKPVDRTMPPEDGCRIALAVEGGGMRGCVTAGMVTAIHHLGLEDTIDVVYGSSAGTVIGAYFITRQLPWYGPEVYYDMLTSAGTDFINTKRFLRALGLGFLDPRLAKDVIFRRNHGKPVLDLSYLLRTTMQENKPLDWETFERMQKVQPLKVMASGLRSEKAIIMDMERGSFRNIKEMASCMQASCLLPGVAGPVMNMNTNAVDDSSETVMIPRNNEGGDGEPLADSLLFEPMPYRAALLEKATHVLVLRSRPDGVDVTGKTSIFEKLIFRRFFLKKNSLRNIYEYMRKGLHKKRYAEDVIVLNEAANDMNRPYSDTEKPHLLPIAVPPGSPEVKRLETGREPILQGVRRGYARAYDALVEDVEQRGRGMEMAMKMFPDDILDYDPKTYTSTHESAYASYL